MKQCPLCKRYFDDENDFCLEDGTPLSASSGSQPFGRYHSTGDMPTEIVPKVPVTPPAGAPTQVYQTPSTYQPPPTRGSSGNMLYLVIGVLATALVAVSAYVFLIRDKGSEPAPSSGNTANSGNTSAAVSAPKPSQVPAAPAANAAMPVSAPSVTPPPTVEGMWSGEIAYPSGTAFSASAQLVDSGINSVKGQITWTIIRSSNPEKRDKVGISATEFVEGSFDPSGKVLTLRGVSKSDPSNIIILDGYRLTISPDSRSFTGVSTKGKTPGRVALRRN